MTDRKSNGCSRAVDGHPHTEKPNAPRWTGGSALAVAIIGTLVSVSTDFEAHATHGDMRAVMSAGLPASARDGRVQVSAPISVAAAPLPKYDERDVFVSPFLPRKNRLAASLEGAIEVDFIPDLVDMIPPNQIFDLVQFPMPDGTLRDLSLREFKVTTDSTTIVVMEPHPSRKRAVVANERFAPEVRLFQGRVIGDERSVVYLSFSSTAIAGFVQAEGQMLSISNGPAGEGPVVISDLKSLPEGAIDWHGYLCGVIEVGEPPSPGDGGTAASWNCKVVELAIETDNEFRSRFSSDQAAIDYTTQILGGLNAIYLNQLNVVPVLNYLRVWSEGVEDPWTAVGASAQVAQFKSAWAGGGPAGSTPRDLAHMFSGRIFGGFAYIGAACSVENAFAYSGSMNGYFPYPLANNHTQNWDIFITAHEIGHIFGSSHTHDIGVDNCPGGSCISNGTLMSYCFQCPGGMGNIVLDFAPANLAQMNAFLPTVGCLAENCGSYLPPILAASDGVFTDAVRLSWTAPVIAATRFEIRRRPVGGAFVSLQPSIPGSATAFDDTTAQINVFYEYQIRAIRFDGVETSWSQAELGYRTPVAFGCATDLNRDGIVDAQDLGQLLGAWNGPAGDIDGSGFTDAFDLARLLADWGSSCSPIPWATVLRYTPDPAVVTSAALRAAISATGLPWHVRDGASQIEMLLVPSGTFSMGCSASAANACSSDENPVHAVTLTESVYIGRYEVTQAEWYARMGSNPSFFRDASTQVPAAQVQSRPVEQVSWNAVQGFLSATGLRLPTEAEWEYAYRAGTTTAFHSMPGFPNGTNLDAQVGSIAWIASNAAAQTRPVGQKAGNALGFHDMSGNVWEWVSDWYSGTYYASSPPVNPAGPANGDYRVVRGGAWTNAVSPRSSVREQFLPQEVNSNIGFRVARSAGTVGAPTITAVAPAYGPTLGGTTITVHGTNLVIATRVTVDGVPATNLVLGTNTITAVTPPGTAGAKTVAVTTPLGVASLENAFTYIAPVPSILGVSPSAGPTTGGTTITITGTNLFGTTSVTVGGVAASGVTVVNSATVIAVTPAGTVGAKTVSVTTPVGTATAAGAFSYVTLPSWATVLEVAPNPAVVTSASLRNAIAATGLPWRVRDNSSNIEMLLVPPGTFNMGCSASNQGTCSSAENPVHAVTLTNAFYIGRYEVTQAQWTAKMGSNPSYFQSASAEVPAAQVPNRPVEQVSWNTIQGFLSATGLRLPTEAEWEYAYRAGTTTAFHSMPGFPNGTNEDTQVGNIAWFSSNSAGQPRPVGGKAANALGLHDMSGNVWEWVNDWHSGSYYTSSPPTNPPGPGVGWSRVLRGGSWSYGSGSLRSSNRGQGTPFDTGVYNGFGFRVARAP